MSKAETTLEPDRLPGLPHPRERFELFGHAEAEQAFLEGVRSGRLHHAWLIGGPRGIGKATLAYRVARFLLAQGAGSTREARSLAVDPDERAARQVAVGAHPNLAVLRRSPGDEKKGPSTTIPVDAVRRAMNLFGATAADGGYRVCIVDSAEDLTAASANALLKVVEEPPPRSLFLIVSHAPQQILPTIRSRSRRLLLRPLASAAIRDALASLGEPWRSASAEALEEAVTMAEGSVARAVEMLDPDRRAMVEAVEGLLRALPTVDWKRTLALAESLGRRDADDLFDLALDTVSRRTSTLMREHAALGPARLAPLTDVCEKITRAAREADIYNLDRRPLIMSLVGDLAEAVRRLA